MKGGIAVIMMLILINTGGNNQNITNTPIPPQTHTNVPTSVLEQKPLNTTPEIKTKQIDPVKREISQYKSINAIVYAYNSEVSQTDSSPCITANGYNLCTSTVQDTIANNCLPFGSVVIVERIRYIVRDRMNSRYGCEVFDIWMPSHADAIKWGKKKIKVFIK